MSGTEKKKKEHQKTDHRNRKRGTQRRKGSSGGWVGEGDREVPVAEKVREGDKRGNEMPQELRGG